MDKKVFVGTYVLMNLIRNFNLGTCSLYLDNGIVCRKLDDLGNSYRYDDDCKVASC